MATHCRSGRLQVKALHQQLLRGSSSGWKRRERDRRTWHLPDVLAIAVVLAQATTALALSPSPLARTGLRPSKFPAKSFLDAFSERRRRTGTSFPAVQRSARLPLLRRGGRAGAIGATASAAGKVVVGLNKYSHDAGVCIASLETGEIKLMWAKERWSRRKHDGGDVGGLMKEALARLDLTLDDVALVVSNNHHFRVLPYERNPEQLRWSAALGHIDEGAASEWNLVPDAEHMELSHHLAHVWSAVAQAPFDEGLVVVMDGMGETYGAMRAAQEAHDDAYMHDLRLSGHAAEGYAPARMLPADMRRAAQQAVHDWREGESVYTFQKLADSGSVDIRPVHKRWIQEVSPPTLYNHGFENMGSAGAVYSRVSSNIFGDWNACGKVMGLAPWHSRWSSAGADDEALGSVGERLGEAAGLPAVMSGSLLDDDGLQIDWERLRMGGNPLAGRTYSLDAGLKDAEGPTNRDVGGSAHAKAAAALARGIQRDLEEVCLAAVGELKRRTGARNLCFVGGVALNSVLNGRLTRELGFAETFIPPYPGDDGIAAGCCAFALFSPLARCRLGGAGGAPPPLWDKPLPPYLGPEYAAAEVGEALDDAAPWLVVEEVPEVEALVQQTAAVVAGGGVVAWWQGRSEAGPRALGHRSLVADPRNASMVAHINSKVKFREDFRPFAPSVLAEAAADWFDGIEPCDAGEEADAEGGSQWGTKRNVSPYMSLTVDVKAGQRDKIPAVTHVDGTSRLQSVTANDEPLYRRLIAAFFKLTGVPMVLNTSFNTIKSEPITESPADGVRSFLHARGAIAQLVMGTHVIRRRPCPLKASIATAEPARWGEEALALTPEAAGAFVMETSEAVAAGGGEVTRVRIRMEASPMACATLNEGWRALTDSLEAELLARCDGATTVGQLLAEFVREGEEAGELGGEEVTARDVTDRLTRLFDECLVSYR